MLRQCGWHGFIRDWDSLSKYLLYRNRRQMQHGILNLSFATTVYYIWMERNARSHENHRTSTRVIVKDIMHIVKCRLHSFSKFQKLRTKSWFSNLSSHHRACFMMPMLYYVFGVCPMTFVLSFLYILLNLATKKKIMY